MTEHKTNSCQSCVKVKSTTMRKQTSLTLLEKLKHPQDQEAWTRFYDFYSPFIFSCARRRGCDKPTAEDVLQDTMGRLWRRMSKFNYDANQGKFHSYLSKVVSSVIWERFHHKVQTYSLDEMLENNQPVDISDPQSLTPMVEFERQWKMNLLYHACDSARKRVSPNTWLAFKLLSQGQKSGKEVAALLGEKRTTVYQRKDRVLRLLRLEVKRLEAEIGDGVASRNYEETQIDDTLLETMRHEIEPPAYHVKDRFELLVKAFQNHAPPTKNGPKLLVITEGNSRWVKVTSPLTIGTHPENKLQLKSQYVSKFHGKLTEGDHHWTVTDRGSMNGIVVNGRKITKKYLYEGDVIQLSDTVLIFTEGVTNDNTIENKCNK